ncbi:DHA2 family efflux MFS transporter permease subunit [Croceicoccus ponticola]|uniref:DHA2 family efflux MFS transporter permease subunit n=1 Tax=Croceicoccus ponticola TaxID=2217664 RepID=A0A437GYK8_9SPHN|nr:DHA2 family efflux MFS transporter permease subunit [Croceicoccus ponticola]RVQ67761.1 DHA2 family efflux MFS transporter permease subunit [Croceicoccus ponticola]
MSDAAVAGGVPDPAAERETAPALADGPRIKTRNRPLLIAGAMTAMVMQVLDTTIANVALPHMQASLSATTDTITWVLTSYVLATAIALPSAGWLVTRFGIRTVFTSSVAAFVIASVLCGLAQNMTQMVLFRVIQGMGGAFLAPLAQTVMLDASSEEERPRMMIIFSQGILLGPIMGPVLGGYITESASWRWIFLINVPVGIIAGLILFTLLPNRKGVTKKFDFAGWALLATAVASFQLMLDRGQQLDWFNSAEIVVYSVLSMATFWMAVVHLVTKEHALFPRQMFADLNLVVCIILNFMFGMVALAVMALLPSLLQQIYGYPAIDAGWLMTPRGLGMLISVTVIGKPISKLEPRLSVAIGLIIMGVSLWMMKGWTPDMPVESIVLAGLVQGFGFSFVFMPLNILAFATLPGEYRTDASSLMNLLRNLGSSIGIAVCTVLLSRNIQINHAELAARITHSSFPVDTDRLQGLGGLGEGALRVIDGMVTEQAAMIAYLNDFWFMALACWATIPLLLLVRPGKKKPVANDAPADIPH